MRVKLYATLRALAGDSTLEVPIDDGGTVRELVDEVARRWPALEEHLIVDGAISRRVNVLVDGRNIRWLPDGEKTVLEPGCNVDLFPPAAGG